MGTSHSKSLNDRGLDSIQNVLLEQRDFVCATLFHSNVNKVSPNRTILAGEEVGIAWLLPNEPGVYWYGVFFPSFSVVLISAGLSMLPLLFMLH